MAEAASADSATQDIGTAAPDTQQWREEVDPLVQSGLIDAEQGRELLGFLQQREAEVSVRLQGMQAEFGARRTRFGEPAALAWLEDAVAALKQDQIAATATIGRDGQSATKSRAGHAATTHAPAATPTVLRRRKRAQKS